MKAVDLFAGCGGLSLGLQNAGIEIQAAFENWEPAAATYSANFTHPIFNLDLFDEDIAIAKIRKFKPDLVAGGPPCQDFSSAGKRDEQGGRGSLTISYAKIVVGIKPEWFLMENVERINKTNIYRQARQIFEEAGYGLTEVILDASYCNVPQKRKRLFLIGKLGMPHGFLTDKILEKLSPTPMTVRDYLGKGIDIEYYYRHPRSYSRRAIFSIDEPSPTIRGVNRPIPPYYKPHPGDSLVKLKKIRSLTFEERAQIQTFPKNFKWLPLSKSVLEQMVGNAVPVNLGQYIGEIIMDFDTKSKTSNTKRKSIKKNPVTAGN